ncbi:Hypothetical protein PYTT_1862 [Akkermansia glycaniphila]|uniref:Uncharacterized protein n=2 Tax=Akkermansia glycaniphila TaxID=1679444 RepID=A0A1C7P9K9_9BACT|nr:hypothetical protein AC781_12700 [Akkermansia glycaniphila]SEH93600.1 Hypothetical protein PYTT_1862 [Akkermansia glycaniphila]
MLLDRIFKCFKKISSLFSWTPGDIGFTPSADPSPNTKWKRIADLYLDNMSYQRMFDGKIHQNAIYIRKANSEECWYTGISNLEKSGESSRPFRMKNSGYKVSFGYEFNELIESLLETYAPQPPTSKDILDTPPEPDYP